MLKKCYFKLPSPSFLPNFLQNAVLTTEYPTYANPANIAEHRATLLTVLSPVAELAAILGFLIDEELPRQDSNKLQHKKPEVKLRYQYKQSQQVIKKVYFNAFFKIESSTRNFDLYLTTALPPW